MSEHLHPGPHLDPDSLNAFIEGVLPEHERIQCLAHLAECSRCREVVFLAQEPRPAPAAPNPAPVWRRWFAPVPVLSAAAAACVIVVAVSLYLRHTPAAPAGDVVARARQAQPVPAPPPPEIREEAQVSSFVTSTARPGAQPRAKRGPARAARHSATDENPPGAALPPDVSLSARGPIPATALLSPPPPPPMKVRPDAVRNQQPPPPPASVSSVPPAAGFASANTKDDRGPAGGISGIAGTVTDPAGAAISGATITLRQLAGTSSSNAQTDARGQFKVAGLPAGRYELQITAPGFRQTSRQVDLPPKDVAMVASELSIGSAAETVEVTAASSMIETAPAAGSRSAAAAARPLPSKLPAATTVARGKLMLAADSAGALFFSRDAGKKWQAVKPLWQGKVVRLFTLAEPAPTSNAAFQLTTDSGSSWVSRDGSHWYPAPPQR